MKKLFAIALATLLPLFASAQTMAVVFGPQQVSIPKNSFTTVARPVPVSVTALGITLSRENWPATGIDVDLQVSYNNQATWESPGPTHLGPPIPNPNHPGITDAGIGVGWNQELRQATHVRATTTNLSGAAFLSTLTISALLVN